MNNEYYYRNRARRAEANLAQMRRDAGYSDPADKILGVAAAIFGVILFVWLSNMFFTWIFGSNIAFVITLCLDAFFIYVGFKQAKAAIKAAWNKNK